MKVSFLGDICFHDDYIDFYKSGKQPFSAVIPVLEKADFVVGNLEGTVEASGENEAKVPRLKTTLETLNYLKDLQVNLALMANNHVYDNLEEGYNKTVRFLQENHIEHIGAGLSKQAAAQPYFLEKEGITICFLNYVSADTNPKLPAGAQLYINHYNVERVIADVKRYKAQANFVVVNPHWGGDFENGYYPSTRLANEATAIFEAGADIIVGHHSHTLQPYETINGKQVFYSLGNFCFADIKAFGTEIDRKKNTEGAILTVNFKEDGTYAFELTSIFNNWSAIELANKLPQLEKRNKKWAKLRNSPTAFKRYQLKHRYFDAVWFFFFGNDRMFFDRLSAIKWRRIKYYIFRR